MILQSILLLGLLGGSGHGSRWANSHVVTKPAGWRLEVDTDRFGGKVTCSLQKQHVRVVNGWVTLQLGRDVYTQYAEVRLDDGPARPARSFPQPLVDPNDTSGDPILNPSGGRVVLPQVEAIHARTAWVRPRPQARVARFDLAGLPEAVAAATRAGCPSEAPGFVR